MIYKGPKENFNPNFKAVGCFVEDNGKILLLHRQDHKPHGNTWGLPSGSIETHDESPLHAMKRELHEETGLKVSLNKLIFHSSVNVRFTDGTDFIYYMYKIKRPKKSIIKINPKEHKDYTWKKPKNALSKLNLIEDLDICFQLVYGIQ